ncbi:hypothetical protein ACFPAF_16395 [Hymenobacter endophyticus]|uniref:YdcF family protein n=1 Tax=Hymenobacter endophyticus TaxID=3076335 RepID=A0ABU3TKS8_9BACT|nr:hypothetical protein [Hymenobacter endophyticus]MDU0371983.1 hypothetical protein [Hymenobacter endophyticus]
MVYFFFQALTLLLVPNLLLLALLALAYLHLTHHPRRVYWAGPGLLTATSGLLLWVMLPDLVAPAYSFSLVFFGLLAALLLPWLPRPAASF